MIRQLPLIAFVALSACAYPMMTPAPYPTTTIAPQTPPPAVNPGSSKDRFIASVTANGCELTSANTQLVLASATLSQQDMARIMTELRAEGRGEIGADGRSFRLTTGACL
ncbi:hypothetical protein [Yoonia vestfoldensis]|jgi:hypothetical protein|uniref:Lipoprotein n=1 Tax=Yoonia vestfoldensis TaxID=245188 RepID=A0A1Y0EBY2_9RHOB|nr:hypothetical protein [Yoonia vestfoldensis]ARU01115.1 hypothetical protein LOKVESSMR4R_01802 [Yoonia vestfoldensis]